MVQLDVVRLQKGFETLAALLRRQILDGSIKPGELLPNERELVERSSLSRGSVREALRVLEAEGLVSTRLGRNGGRVAMAPSDETLRRSVEVFVRGQRAPFTTLLEAAEVLEPALAQLAALHRDEADLKALAKERAQLAATRTSGRFVTLNARWHRTMARASHNPILVAVYEAIGSDLLNPGVKGFVSAEMRASVVQAIEKIEQAIVAGDGETARRRMARHVLAYRSAVERVAPKAVTL